MLSTTKHYAAAALLLLSTFALSAAEPANIVFLYGSRSHGSGSHEFQAGAKLLAKCLNRQTAVPVKCTTHPGWPKDNLKMLEDADAIIFYNDSTKIVRNGWDVVDGYAKKGKGLMFMHYAVHPSPAEGEKYFKPWMGAYFKNGESVNPFWKADIKPLKGHPTAGGVGDISCIDEFYHSLDFCGDCKLHKLGVAIPTTENLLTINNLWHPVGAASLGKEVPLLWGIDRPDGGRGAGFTGGHFHHNWAYNDLRRLVMNTIVWVAGREVPKGGMPVKDLTEDELNANLDDYGARTVRLALPTPENRPKFTPNDYLTPAQRKTVRKENPEWEKRRGRLAGGEVVPVKK
jgi:hypothetical protein